jgi:uncharacterized protein with PIN domain
MKVCPKCNTKNLKKVSTQSIENDNGNVVNLYQCSNCNNENIEIESID